MKAARSVRRCPECRAVAPKRLRTTLRWRGIAFCECPKCGIGSPREQWMSVAKKAAKKAVELKWDCEVVMHGRTRFGHALLNIRHEPDGGKAAPKSL